MIMYFVATGKKPFANLPCDQYLAISIWNGLRPEINEPEAPKCYIDLMKKCWDSDLDNRSEVKELIKLFNDSLRIYYLLNKEPRHYEIEKQFKEAEEYREAEGRKKVDIEGQPTHVSIDIRGSIKTKTVTEDFWGFDMDIKAD